MKENKGSTSRAMGILLALLSLLILQDGSVTAAGPPQPAWVARYDSVIDETFLVGKDAAVDSAGNVYVTGLDAPTLGSFDYDYATIKFDQNGNQVWGARYAGPAGDSRDEATAIALDGAGNVYITGRSIGVELGFDYATIKYDSNGNQVWVARYNSGGSAWDEAVDIVVDGAGAVYVTGTNDTLEPDFLTVKYDTNGSLQWAVQFGQDLSDEKPSALVVDSFGNVIVTGEFLAYDPTTFTYESAYKTVKYDSDGNQLWVATYQYSTDSSNTAKAVTLDESDNIYVTGASNGAGFDTDYATIKYSPSGSQQWVARYDGASSGVDKTDTPYAIHVDAAGNVIVTGESKGSDATDYFATVKYDQNGNQLWETRLARGDSPRGILTDASGNVYVSGSGSLPFVFGRDFVVVKYSINGSLLWEATYNSSSGTNSDDLVLGMGLDSAGNVYLGGRSEFKYAAVKFDSSGSQQWSVQSNYGISRDVPVALALDGERNVYVTGSATVKYSLQGSELWTTQEKATDIAVDGAGNAFLVRSVRRATGNDFTDDYEIVKLGSSGDTLWTRQTDWVQGWDEPAAVATDNLGNVYITGSAGRPFGFEPYDFGTLKYDATGNLQWAVSYTAQGTFTDDRPADIFVDAAGNVYITGWSYSGESIFNSTSDYLTVRYDSNGTQQWVARYDGPENKNDLANAVAVDGAGNTYITGYSIGSNTFADIATIKYDSAGNLVWAAHYNSPANDPDLGIDVAVDGSGNVLVTGETLIGQNASQFVTIQYDSSGVQQWVATYQGPAGGINTPSELALDHQGNPYVTGKRFDGATFDYVTIKYDGASGAEDWAVTYDGPAGNLDETAAMALDAYGNIYVTGISDGGNTGYDFATIKYQVQEPPAASPEGYTIDEDTPLVEGAPGVLSNDTDDDNDPLTAILDSEPIHGALTLSSDGSFTYNPDANYCGPDSFSYHANDGQDDSNVVTVTIDVTCTNDPPLIVADDPAVAVDEGTLASNTGAVSDVEGDAVTLQVSAGAVDSNGGAWSWSFATSDGPTESQSVTITADDGQGGISQAVFDLTVSNVPPAVEDVTVPAEPVSLGDQPIGVRVEFSDPGEADTHGVTWDWGDGTTDTQPSATSPITLTHTYTQTGVYAVGVTVADDDGGSDSSPLEFVVVYDPDGGFVTGGGWIWSEPGWCRLDDLCAGVEGAARFGFVSKYTRGQNVPIGNTHFNFSAGGLIFHSDAYDWLVVNQGGTNAQFKGSGEINGGPAPTGEAYKFMIWARDLDPGGIDTMRIKIWYDDSGEFVVYDNGTHQPIGGGNIVVHD